MMRYPKWARFALPLFLLLVTLLPIYPPSLLVASEGRILGEYPVDGVQCEVWFYHSINKGLVREIYSIDARARTLSLTRGYFENYGAGMIDTVPPEVKLSSDDECLILDFPPEPVREVNYIAGIVSQHRFSYDGASLALFELAPRKPVRITVRRASFLQRALRLA